MATIREAQQEDSSRVREFYERTGYLNPIEPSDRILIAETQCGIVGALRLCREGGVHVLRGMRVLEGMRHQRIGTSLLLAFEHTMCPATCYCIPYDYLEDFYRSAGFQKLTPQDAPRFLQERLREYEGRGLNVIVMKRSS